MSNTWQLYKIPKIAHFYWHGGMLSWLRYLTLKTFQIHNPDWELCFYYPKIEHTGEADWEAHSKERTGVTGKNYLNLVKQIPNTKCIELDFSKDFGDIPDVYRSDLLRLKLLGQRGGLWCDMDIITFKPMNESIFNFPSNRDLDTILSYSLVKNHYSIGYMLSSKDNKFFNYLYEKGTEKESPADYLFKKYGDRQRYGVIHWDTYFPHIDKIATKFPDLNVYNFEFKVCYPIIYNEMDNMLTNNVSIGDEYTSLHGYFGHPDTRFWENVLTPENYKEYNNTLCACIKKGLKE